MPDDHALPLSLEEALTNMAIVLSMYISYGESEQRRTYPTEMAVEQVKHGQRDLAKVRSNIESAIGQLYRIGYDVPYHWQPPVSPNDWPDIRLQREPNEAFGEVIKGAVDVTWARRAQHEIVAERRKVHARSGDNGIPAGTRQETDIMTKKSTSDLTDPLARLHIWLDAAQEVVHHIGCTRGISAAYYTQLQRDPWPSEAADILRRKSPTVVKYLRETHALKVGCALERIAQTAAMWMTKRAGIEAFAKGEHTDGNAAIAAIHELARVTEEGLPEQRRLDLDLRIAEGAVWRASFPCLANRLGAKQPFIIRGNLVRWAIWVREAFAETIREWPNERTDPDGYVESVERWQLANVVFPDEIPNTNESPHKLGIEEARRVGDLTLALPRIDSLMDTLEAFVTQAARWPQGNLQPALTEQLCHAMTDLERLVGIQKPATKGAENRSRGNGGKPNTSNVKKSKRRKRTLSKMEPRQREAWTIYQREHNYAEVGRQMSISGERARQLVERAESKIDAMQRVGQPGVSVEPSQDLPHDDRGQITTVNPRNRRKPI